MLIALAVGTGSMGFAWLVAGTPTTEVDIDPRRISVARVERGEFTEFIPVLGTVEPITTVYLDAVEGGTVEEIFVDDGVPIEKGKLILRLSNSTLQKESISTESRLLENINTLRNTKINLTEKELILKQELLDTEYQIVELSKKVKRYKAIVENTPNSLAEAEYETAVDGLDYYTKRRDIIQARIVQERMLREQQMQQVDRTIERVERNLEIIATTLEDLDVRAPISGHLSALKVELGQSVVKGENIGQIDVLDAFKVRGRVDQHYIAQVAVGQTAEYRYGGGVHPLTLTKIYPEVTDDVFLVDMEFVDAPPEGIKRGQTAQINLGLGAASQSLKLPKGGFYRSTAGRWIYRVGDDGLSASRVDIRVGRQNTQYYELLEGLSEGDWVIVSSYDGFSNTPEIKFESPLAIEAKRS